MLDVKKIEQAVNLLSTEKKIPKETIIEIIESAIKTAYKKDYWNKDEEVVVRLDLEAGSIEIVIQKIVVKEVTNPYTEISFEELWDNASSFSEWDMVEIDVTEDVLASSIADSFWRIASQAARQVVIQKIWDNEKERIYNLFKDKIWEVLNMKVVMVESGKVILDYNWNNVILPKSEQVSKDNYTPDQRFFVYVAQAINDEKIGPRVTLSRKNKNIVEALFNLNIPEVSSWIIKIDELVRARWVKTKLLVSTTDETIDPVWSLIGQKWVRIKTIMQELSWEKMDIINNNLPIEEKIAKSLTPAEIIKVEVDEEQKTAKAYLNSSQRAKAIWKNGINIALASKLTGYTISVLEIWE